MKTLPISEDLDAFLRACEAHCLYDCCGKNALVVSEDMLSRWKQKTNPGIVRGALSAIRDLKSMTEESNESVIFITEHWSRDELLPWLSNCERMLILIEEGKIK